MENNQSIKNKKENILFSFLPIVIAIVSLIISLICFFNNLQEKNFPDFFLQYLREKLVVKVLIVILVILVILVISVFILYWLNNLKNKELSKLKSEVIDLCISIENIEDKLLNHDKNKKFRFTNFKKLETAKKLEFSKYQQTKINKNISKNKFNNIIIELNIIDNLSQIEKKISILNPLFANAFVTISIIATLFSPFLSCIISHEGKYVLHAAFIFSYLSCFFALTVFYLLRLSQIYSEKIYDDLSYSDYSILIPTYIDILRNNLISIQDNNNQDIIKTNQKNIKGKHLSSEEKIETVLTKTRTKTKTRNIKKR